MKKIIFRRLCLAMCITLGMCLLLYPLLLPTENYFRLVLQITPVALFIGLVLLIPLRIVSDRMSRNITAQLKTLKLDSRQALSEYPELRPLARQVTSLKAQIATQLNELTGQQEQLRVLTDNMQEGLLLVSASGRVLSYNHAALKLLDREGLEDDFFSVYSLNQSRQFREIVKNALNGIRGNTIITVNDVACQLIANPVMRESRMTGAAIVLMDVTEREKRDALRREFTSNVSHELKTPLTSIYGIADMMETGMVRAEDISGFARKIRDESSRMITLIEDIIRLSRLDDESFAEEVLPLDLYEIAENVKLQLREAAENKGITVTLEGGTAPMDGVPVIVEEMLYNLCDNAIKYNKENGTVRMKVCCSDNGAVFSVSDTGIGIPQPDKERIFERFYRVDKSHSKQIGGTGLGLSIVKHGAAFHNASIELESQLGQGTTITLYFPRNAQAAAAAEGQAKLDPLNVELPDDKPQPLITVLESDPAEKADSDAEAAADGQPEKPQTPPKRKKRRKPVQTADTGQTGSADGQSAGDAAPQPEEQPEPAASEAEASEPVAEEAAPEVTKQQAELPEASAEQMPAETEQTVQPEAAPVKRKRRRKPAAASRTEQPEPADDAAAAGQEPAEQLTLTEAAAPSEAAQNSAEDSAPEKKPVRRKKPRPEHVSVTPINQETMDVKL